MAAVPLVQTDREGIYAQLKASAVPNPNSEWLGRIVASWRVGEGVLPDGLGLAPDRFRALMQRLFPGCPVPARAMSGKSADFGRMLEKEDLERLLRRFANPEVAEAEEIIAIVVAGCLGSDHLWQDMGLWSRRDLSQMLEYNFPSLVEKNAKDMKWKKFLYKQLCEAEGLYLCRAPSCEVCADYGNCFGPEA